MMRPGIYLSGPITGIRNYRERFAAAEIMLREMGWAPVNPAALPQGFDRRTYMAMDLMTMLNCPAVVMLTGWEDSAGARIEKALAEYVGLTVYGSLDEVPEVGEEEI